MVSSERLKKPKGKPGKDWREKRQGELRQNPSCEKVVLLQRATVGFEYIRSNQSVRVTYWVWADSRPSWRLYEDFYQKQTFELVNYWWAERFVRGCSTTLSQSHCDFGLVPCARSWQLMSMIVADKVENSPEVLLSTSGRPGNCCFGLSQDQVRVRNPESNGTIGYLEKHQMY